MYLPQPFKKFESQYPEVVKLYEELGVKCQSAGPLDAKTRYLVNLGIAVGAVSPGAVKSHAVKPWSKGLPAKNFTMRSYSPSPRWDFRQ